MSYNSAYCVLNILIHCLMINIQLIELNPEGTQILDSDSRPRGDKKRKRSKERRYQHVSEMTKDLREALRVNKTFAVFFIFYKFTDNNIFLERFILESGKNASGNSIRYRKNVRVSKGSCS